MQAKPLHPRRLSRSVKPVALLALAMTMALLSALLIVHNLAQATDPYLLSGFSSQHTEPFFLIANDGGLIDHSPLANSKLSSEPDPSLLRTEPNVYRSPNATR